MIRFTITGTDGHGREYEISGHHAGHNLLDPDCFTEIGQAAFQMLTQGKARYGHPGKGGCRGPYDVSELHLKRLPS